MVFFDLACAHQRVRDHPSIIILYSYRYSLLEFRWKLAIFGSITFFNEDGSSRVLLILRERVIYMGWPSIIRPGSLSSLTLTNVPQSTRIIYIFSTRVYNERNKRVKEVLLSCTIHNRKYESIATRDTSANLVTGPSGVFAKVKSSSGRSFLIISHVAVPTTKIVVVFFKRPVDRFFSFSLYLIDRVYPPPVNPQTALLSCKIRL